MIYEKITNIIDDAKVNGDQDTDAYAGAILNLFKGGGLVLRFDNGAWDSFAHVLYALAGFTLTVEYTVNGFPEHCAIVAPDSTELVVCEVDDTGRPITNVKFHVPYEDIISITVL